jgi:hypothetical protein
MSAPYWFGAARRRKFRFRLKVASVASGVVNE